jgi:NAD(P)-dependent dehydrogenase (short-subunit alcohol dehydrogenase family)
VEKQTDAAAQTAEPRLLDGKVALVTGGGRGLGREICTVLAEAGAAVVVADVRSELAETTARELGVTGATVLALTMDVSDEASVTTALDEVREHLGRVDILVNNAGTDKTLSLEEISVEEWTRVVDVNLVGPFLTTKGVFPTMRENGGGHIVNITSTAAKRAWANASAYHASKWGLLGFSHAAHVEGRPYNIKVTALISGGMRTPFLLDRFPDIDLETLQDPRNVAETVLFVVTRPRDAVIPELMVLPMGETSWP